MSVFLLNLCVVDSDCCSYSSCLYKAVLINYPTRREKDVLIRKNYKIFDESGLNLITKMRNFTEQLNENTMGEIIYR